MWTPTYRKFKSTLMSMCRMTTPHGHEPYVWAHLPGPPFGSCPGGARNYGGGSTQVDRDGNYIVTIPGPGSRVLWTAHCDTADSEPKLVNMKWRGDTLMTDGRSILGADDKVGCAIMAMMIRAGCPGTYAFFQGEEVGCVGSRAMAQETPILDYDACISLDRRGYESVITRQRGDRCCSDKWATDLSTAIYNESGGDISLRPDPTGVFTDSAEFTDLIPECTNLSVGYFSQHTHAEKTDVSFAYSLCCALIKVAHKNLVPLPVRDLLDKTDDDCDNRYSWMYRFQDYDLKDDHDHLKYRFNKSDRKLCDPDFMSEDDWKDWRHTQ